MTVVVVGGTWGQISLSEENVPQHFINILCPEEGRQAETLTKSLLSFNKIKPTFLENPPSSSLEFKFPRIRLVPVGAVVSILVLVFLLAIPDLTFGSRFMLLVCSKSHV